MSDDPWEDIHVPVNVNTLALKRTIEGPDKQRFFRGKDHYGRYVFQFSGDFEITATSLPKSTNDDISVEGTKSKRSDLVFTLLNPEFQSLFRHLVLDMISSVSQAGNVDDSTAANLVLKRFTRWQELLRKAGSALLSPSEILGLYGELLFLRDILIPKTTPIHALESWRGPIGDEQDYLINDVLIEIKSQGASADNKIWVSSANQLDDKSGKIFLCHQTFSVSAVAVANASSLNDLVSEIRNILADNKTAYELLENGLILSGYNSRGEYDRPIFSKQDRNFYAVRDNFPRIRASDIAVAVIEVKYCVLLSACSDFQLSTAEFEKAVF